MGNKLAGGGGSSSGAAAASATADSSSHDNRLGSRPTTGSLNGVSSSDLPAAATSVGGGGGEVSGAGAAGEPDMSGLAEVPPPMMPISSVPGALATATAAASATAADTTNVRQSYLLHTGILMGMGVGWA